MAPGRKTGGRVKGSRNKVKRMTRDALFTYCAERDVNPFEFMVDVIEDTSQEMRDRIACAKELNKYLLPQLRQTEIDLGEKTRKTLMHRYGRRRDDH